MIWWCLLRREVQFRPTRGLIVFPVEGTNGITHLDIIRSLFCFRSGCCTRAIGAANDDDEEDWWSLNVYDDGEKVVTHGGVGDSVTYSYVRDVSSIPSSEPWTVSPSMTSPELNTNPSPLGLYCTSDSDCSDSSVDSRCSFPVRTVTILML